MNVPTSQDFPENDQLTMEHQQCPADHTNRRGHRNNRRHGKTKVRSRKAQCIIAFSIAGCMVIILAMSAIFALSAMRVKEELSPILSIAGKLNDNILHSDTAATQNNLRTIRGHIDAAHHETSSLVWKLAAHVPYVGADIAAVQRSVDALAVVSNRTVQPLEQAVEHFSLNGVSMSEGTITLPGLAQAAPYIVQAHEGVQDAASIMTTISPVKIASLQSKLSEFREALSTLENGLSLMADVSRLAPSMLDLDDAGGRNYLVLSQTNAELRPRGGMPGSWGVIHVSNGTLSIQPFVSVGELPWLDEAIIPLSVNEELLFTDKLARIGQDVNFTPDFPKTGEIAQAMWERQYQQTIDGVLAIDPVALESLIEVVGEVSLDDGTHLTSQNTQQTLLHDVYVNKPVDEQDRFFSEAAGRCFEKLMEYSGSPADLLKGMTAMATGGHTLLWSAHQQEEDILRQTAIAGDLETDPEQPQIGVFFSDQTQSKMDWYLQRETSIESVSRTKNGTNEYKLRISIRNLMKAEEVASTPAYVLGDLPNGLQAGQIDTAIFVYAPAFGGITRSEMSDGSQMEAIIAHEGLTVGLKKKILNPGESFEIIVYLQSAQSVTTPAQLVQTPLTLTHDSE